MRKSMIMLIAVSFVAIRCTTEVEETPQPQQVQPELMAKSQIDDLIFESLKSNNEFNWSDVSDQVLWSALMHGDSVLTIGYQPAGEADVNSRMSEVNVNDKAWKDSRESLITETTSRMKMLHEDFDSDQMELRSHDVLPFFDVKITNVEMITYYRQHAEVRYTEPLGYEVDFSRFSNGRAESDSGCSNDADYGLPTSDYTIVAPGAKASWNYDDMGITQAWNYSTGDDITVGVIDTGLSPDQAKLNSQFNSGWSQGRTVNKYGFYVSSWWWWASPDGPNDQCGHGTAMAGVVAAPRSSDGSAVGVAYNSNLVSVRGTGDVVVNGGKEKTGVADALVYLGNRSDVRIISMSIGDVFSNSKVADAVRYAYGKGKLIFSAAGTSTSFTNWYGVIFPATMNETVAVTGVKEGSYTRCDVCHSGDKVDFTVVMERAGSNRHPLTVAMSGNQPATVGGSSVATATAAGIAALVWARNPSLTRDQVLTKMIQTSDLYPNRSGSYGWGNLDALAAVLQ